MKYRNFLLIVAALACMALIVSPLYANTPIGPTIYVLGFWAVVLTLAVTAIESIVVSITTRVGWLEAFLYLFFSNCFSAFIGAWGWNNIHLLWAKLHLPPISLPGVPVFLLVLWILFFLTTLVIEWPFYYLLTARQARPFRSSLKAVITAHAFSYAFLILWFCATSDLSVYTDFDFDAPNKFVARDDLVVYFISQDGGYLCRVRLDGSAPERLVPVHHRWGTVQSTRFETIDKRALLLVDPASRHPSFLFDEMSCIIGASHHGGNLKQGEASLVVPELSGHCEYAIDLREPEDRKHEVVMRGWRQRPPLQLYTTDILYYDRQTLRHEVVCLSTLFWNWGPQNAAVTPGDQVVFQNGQEILLLDFGKHKIGVIAEGREPIVGLVAPP